MQIRSSKSDIIWNYIGIIVSMFSNLLMLPFLMKYIDGELLGLWYVYLSIGGIVALFDFGFNPTLARNVAYCWSGAQSLSAEGVCATSSDKPNFLLLKHVTTTCKYIYLIIAGIALIVLLSVGSIYVYHVSKEIFGRSVIVSWIMYVFAVFFNLYYGYFATFLRGVGAVSIYNKINVVSRLFQIAISITLLIMGYGIVAVSFAYLLYGFSLRFFSKRAFYKYSDIGEQMKSVQEKTSVEDVKKLFSIVWHNAWKDGLVSVSNYCASQASTLVASLFLSLTETGVYSISVQLVNAITTISAGLYTAYQPAMQSSYANNNHKEAKRLMSISMILYFILFWLGIVLLITIGIPILKWVKPDNTYSAVIILGIAIYNFFYKRQSYYASFISNTNHVPYMTSYVIFSIIGVFLSVLMINYANMGVWGLIIGQFLPQIVYNVWKWPNEVYKMLDTNWCNFISTGVCSIANIRKDKYQ